MLGLGLGSGYNRFRVFGYFLYVYIYISKVIWGKLFFLVLFFLLSKMIMRFVIEFF